MLQIEHRDSEIRVLMKMLHRPAGEAVHNSRSLSVVRGDMAASCVFMSGWSSRTSLHSVFNLHEALSAFLRRLQGRVPSSQIPSPTRVFPGDLGVSSSICCSMPSRVVAKPDCNVKNERLGNELVSYRVQDKVLCVAGKQQSSTQEPWPDLEVIADRERALQYWEEHHFDGSALQENKQALRQHYREAKQLGDKVSTGHNSHHMHDN